MLKDLILRIRSRSPLTTKGTNLANTEADDDLLIFYDALKIILDPTKYPTWDNADTYNTGEFTEYNGILYESQTDGNTGNIPDEITSPQLWAEAAESDYFTARRDRKSVV